MPPFGQEVNILILFKMRLTYYRMNDVHYHDHLNFLVKSDRFSLIFNATAPQALGQSLPAYAREQQQDRFGPRVEECVGEFAMTLVFHIV
jgi:hypothetical protein